MNNVIHISQIYPCTEVSLAVELQYIVELGKYLKDYDKVLSVDGVDFHDILTRSKYFDFLRVGVANGWVVDCNRDDLEITEFSDIDYTAGFRNVHVVEEQVSFNQADFGKRKADAYYDYSTPKDIQVTFKEKEDKYWYWAIDHDYILNTNSMCSYGSEMVCVSLLAYVAVKRLMTGKPSSLMLEFSYSLVTTPIVLTSFLLLQEETDACKGWCYYTYSDNVAEVNINQLGYTAWYQKGVDRGYLKRWFSPDEKLDMLSELNLKEGDVCYLYERKNSQKMDYVKSIEGFHFCIIDKIDRKGIKFRVVNNKKTLAQGEHDYADLTMATKRMYDFTNPYTKANITVKTLDMSDLGVGYCMYSEQYFITPCTNDDYREQWVGSDVWSPVQVVLPALDLVYWILKDYNIQFDDIRYRERYKLDMPMYERYHATGVIGK